jgi:hypothetical protein
MDGCRFTLMFRIFTFTVWLFFPGFGYGQPKFQAFSATDSLYFRSVNDLFRGKITQLDPQNYRYLRVRMNCPGDSEQCAHPSFTAFYDGYYSNEAFYFTPGGTEMIYFLPGGYGRIHLQPRPYVIERSSNLYLRILSPQGVLLDSRHSGLNNLVPGLTDSTALSFVQIRNSKPRTMARVIVGKTVFSSLDTIQRVRQQLCACRLLQVIFPKGTSLDTARLPQQLFLLDSKFGSGGRIHEGDTLLVEIAEESWFDQERGERYAYYHVVDFMPCPKRIDTNLYFYFPDHYERPLINYDPPVVYHISSVRRFLHPGDSTGNSWRAGRDMRRYRRYRFFHRRHCPPLDEFYDEPMMYLVRRRMYMQRF